jgi:hypothetical protein
MQLPTLAQWESQDGFDCVSNGHLGVVPEQLRDHSRPRPVRLLPMHRLRSQVKSRSLSLGI